MSKFFGALTLAGVLAAGVAFFAVANARSQHSSNEVRKAVVVLFPSQTSRVAGRLEVVPSGSGVRVTGYVTGLPANSRHGFHIHEFGDMTKRDGTSLGGHYNPSAMPHGLPGGERRHVGDMGNLQSNARGQAEVDVTLPDVALQAILGRGVVVHEKADDGGQPLGNAGGRIGFGVIGVAIP